MTAPDESDNKPPALDEWSAIFGESVPVTAKAMFGLPPGVTIPSIDQVRQAWDRALATVRSDSEAFPTIDPVMLARPSWPGADTLAMLLGVQPGFAVANDSPLRSLRDCYKAWVRHFYPFEPDDAIPMTKYLMEHFCHDHQLSESPLYNPEFRIGRRGKDRGGGQPSENVPSTEEWRVWMESRHIDVRSEDAPSRDKDRADAKKKFAPNGRVPQGLIKNIDQLHSELRANDKKASGRPANKSA